jgi:hypothetical protein
MKPVVLLAALSMTFLSSPICREAQATTGNQIVAGCEASLENENQEQFYQGICSGVAEGLVFAGRSIGICAPATATNGQVLRVVAYYLHSHPELLNLQFTELAYAALKAAWPCR